MPSGPHALGLGTRVPANAPSEVALGLEIVSLYARIAELHSAELMIFYTQVGNRRFDGRNT